MLLSADLPSVHGAEGIISTHYTAQKQPFTPYMLTRDNDYCEAYLYLWFIFTDLERILIYIKEQITHCELYVWEWNLSWGYFMLTLDGASCWRRHSAVCSPSGQCVYASACLTTVYTFTWLSRNNTDKRHKNVKWQWCAQVYRLHGLRWRAYLTGPKE